MAVEDRVLVTGATGTVGRHLVAELADRGVNVRACVHSAGKAGALGWSGVETAEVDYGKKNTVERAFHGVTRLYLLTPFTPDQVQIARMLVDAAKKAGVRHIVKQSAMGAGAEPGITLGRLHREAERYIEQSAVPYTFIRPNSFMQNFVNFFGGSIKTEGRIYLPLGTGRVSYIDARDIANCAAEILTNSGHENKTYTVTGPAALSVTDVARVFSRVLGKDVRYADVPEEAAKEGMMKAGMDEWAVACLLELHAICKAGYASRVTSDVQEVSGRSPITFEKFASDIARPLKG